MARSRPLAVSFLVIRMFPFLPIAYRDGIIFPDER